MKKELLINKTLFLFLFFVFKYYIFINLYNKIKYIPKKYFNNNNKNFFFMLYLLLKNNNIKFILDKFSYFDFFDNKIYIFVEFLNNNIYLKKYKFNYLNKNQNIKIYFFFDFYLRIDLVLFIHYKYYMNYFRICKYNEYLTIHPVLHKFPLLKKYLRKLLVERTNKTLLNFSFEESIFKFFKLYLYNYKVDKMFKFNNKYNLKNLNLIYSKIKWFKFLNILKYNYSFLFYYFGEFFLLHLYVYIYNITVYNYEIDDWVEIKKFRINSLKNNFWQQSRYGFKFFPWLYMLVISYISKLIFNDYLYIYNLIDIKKINNRILNIFWYKILKIVIIEKINYSYFLWFRELLLGLNNKKRIKQVEKYIKIWKILLNSYIFEYINVNYNYLNINNINFNLEYVFWNIFFIGDNIYNIYFKYNILFIIKKINIDNIIYLKLNYYLELLRNLLHCIFNSYTLINILFCFLFLKDLFFKIFFHKNFNNNIFSIYIYNMIYNKMLYNQRKIIFYNYQKYFLENTFDNYKIKNHKFYDFLFEDNLIIYMYIIFFSLYDFNHI
jgi:hypothetical protein